MSPSSKGYLGRDRFAATGRKASAGTCRPLGAMCPASAPEGTAMLAGLTGKHIARAGRLGSGPALGPHFMHHGRPAACGVQP